MTAGLWRTALILGLDGMSLRLVDELLPRGTMPRLSALMSGGAAGPLTSVLPTQSAPAWASFFTGLRPGRHGVFDFLERQAGGTYRHARPPAEATLWRVLERNGLRTGVAHFPVTFPPSPIAGFMAAGMLVPDGAVFTHPPEWSERLRAALPGYRLDVKWQLYAGREAALLRELEVEIGQRLEAALWMAGECHVDCLAVAFLEPDRLQHALWRHLDPDHPEHDPRQAARWREPIARVYRALDDAIGRLLDRCGPGTGVMAISDHGFQAAGRQFQVDRWLAKQGWLAYRPGARWVGLARRLDVPWVQHVRRRLVRDVSRRVVALAPGGVVDWQRTVAYCPWTVQQAIRLNVRGREPHGMVEPGAEARRLLDAIRQALADATDPRTGRPVIDRVWDGRDYFRDTGSPHVPDLAFTLKPGYASGPHDPRLWARVPWASGDHSLEGFWAVATLPDGGPDPIVRRRPLAAELVDAAPTLYYLLGLPIPAGLDGVPLTGVVEPALRALAPVRIEDRPAAAYADAQRPDQPPLTAAEHDELRDRLRGLGYLP